MGFLKIFGMSLMLDCTVLYIATVHNSVELGEFLVTFFSNSWRKSMLNGVFILLVYFILQPYIKVSNLGR